MNGLPLSYKKCMIYESAREPDDRQKEYEVMYAKHNTVYGGAMLVRYGVSDR